VGDGGDGWSVTFSDDETALAVLESLRGQLFKGQPIQARIKTETHRNYVAPQGYPVDGSNPYYSYPPPPPQVFVNVVPYPVQYWDGRGGYRGNYEGSRGGRGLGRGKRREYGSRGGRGPRSESTRGSSQDRSNGPSSSTRKRRGSQGNPGIQLGSADFPPLPSAAFEQSKTKYTGEFAKYTKQDLVNIVSALDKDKIVKPADLPNIEKVSLDKPDVEVEVLKPYPKRVTAAEIVQMNPPISPKGSESKSPRSIEAPQQSTEKQAERQSPEKEKEKKQLPEKSKGSRPDKAHNGNQSKGGSKERKGKDARGPKENKEKKG